jgi:hypothetical protein
MWQDYRSFDIFTFLLNRRLGGAKYKIGSGVEIEKWKDL